ncbi:MAG TPA: hypothetical protein VJM32_07000 [Candidatus Saccharimonadales bacterium]|nr:hypothetical protein [Candidatus Saccharimonadales bacterium]
MLVLVVPSDGIADARARSVHPYFVAQARVPAEYLHLPYGYISRQPKGDSYVNIWKFAEAVQSGAVGLKATHGLPLGVEEGIGDDGTLRWEVALGRGGVTVFNGSIDGVNGALLRLIKRGDTLMLPDAIALVARQDLGEVRSACEHAGIETIVIDYDGQLALDRTI